MAFNTRTQNRLAALVRRLPGTALVLLLLLAVGGGLLWYLMTQSSAALPEHATLPALNERAAIGWHANGTATLRAASPHDVYATLGYAHGIRRAWQLALWRQTATGRLAEWFGPGVLPLDRHARRLGLGAVAHAAYADLPAPEKARLQAYATGVNAALTGKSLRRHHAFALLDIDPEPWAPWHALAIERLFGWLATPPPTQPARADSVWADTAVASFARDDARFRQWLHLHRFDRSIAWAVRRDSGAFVFQRHVYGSAATPLFQPVVIEQDNRSVQAVSLPGTPFLPTGQAGTRRWTFFLQSALDLTRAPLDSSAVSVDHQRIRTREGNELLLTIPRLPGALPLGPASAPPDTSSSPPTDSVAAPAQPPDPQQTWHLTWAGWRPVSDAAAWHQLVSGQRPSFELLTGSGLWVEKSNWRVQGTPAVTEPLPNGIFVGQTDWARHQAQSLRALLAQPPADLSALSRNDSSSWAAALAPRLLPTLQGLALSDSTITAALTYLRNWDFHYDRASIGAAIWDAWMRALVRRTGNRPTASDTTSGRASRTAFQSAIDTLTHRFGADVRRWRWERIRPDTRHFPVWSADHLVAQDLSTMARTRYAPLTYPGHGHPSVPAGGASLMDSRRPAPAAWDGWSAVNSPLMMRQRQLDLDAFLERYSFGDGGAVRGPIRSGAPVQTTVLLPDEP